MKRTQARLVRQLVSAMAVLSFTLRAGEMLEVDNVTLALAFEDNPVRADAIYTGKRILVYGPVDKVRRGPVVVLPGIGDFGNVLCNMKGSQESKVASLEIPGEVGVEGTCKGSLGRQIVIEDCVIRDTWRQKEQQAAEVQAEEAQRKQAAKDEAERQAALHSATTTGAGSAGLAASLVRDDPADPEARLKAVLERNPKDREAHAALGHLYFDKADRDAQALPSAMEHLSRAAGNDFDSKGDISEWLGKARFELAYIYYQQKDYDRSLVLVEAVDDRRSSMEEPAPTYHLLRAKLLEMTVGQIPERRQFMRKCTVVEEYGRYFSPKIKAGKGLSEDDCGLYLHMWEYALKIRAENYIMGQLGDHAEQVLKVGDVKTIRAVAKLMEKYNSYGLSYHIKRINQGLGTNH